LTDWSLIVHEGVEALQLDVRAAPTGRPYMTGRIGRPPSDPRAHLAAYAAQTLHRRLVAGPARAGADDDLRGASLALAHAASPHSVSSALVARYRSGLARALLREIEGPCPEGALCSLAGRAAPRDLLTSVRPQPRLVWSNPASR
jgi:hypothetical protein